MWKGYYKINFKEPPLLICFYLVLTISFIFISTGEKSFNHYLLWSIPILFYFFMFKRQIYRLYSLDEIKKDLLGVITIATITACGFAVIEFVLVNFVGLDMSIIPRGSVENYTPLALDRIRARSFMEESGQFAFFCEIFAPISVYWINKYEENNLKKLIALSVIFSGFLLSFSAVGFLCILLWIFAFSFYMLKEMNGGASKLIFITTTIFIILLLIILASDLVDSFSIIINNKLDPDNGSHSDRESRFAALSYFEGVNMITGYGPAAFDTLKIDSFISFYLGILMNTGLLGLLFYILFICRQFVFVRNMSDRGLKFAFTLSILFSSIHLMFVDVIYVPWFWVMLSLSNVIYFKEKQIRRTNLITQ